MPSDSKKRKEQQKKEARKKVNKKQANQQDDENGSSDEQNTSLNGDVEKTNGETTNAHAAVDELCNSMDKFSFIEKMNAQNRSCTGVLSSHPNGRDVHIDQFSLTFYGQEILVDSHLELNNGRRYGIIGLNGKIN
jgi:hypothetical protein